MLPEIAQLLLIMAFVIALLQTRALFSSAAVLVQGYRRISMAQQLCVVLAALVLFYGLWTNDFTVRYIAANSNQYLPWFYRLAAFWGGHEGSFLLWMLVLAIWSVVFLRAIRSYSTRDQLLLIGLLSLVSMVLLGFEIFTSSPFTRWLPYGPAQGRDLNPLLQDLGLILHPPILYVGYVALVFPFIFALFALIKGELTDRDITLMRNFNGVAFGFLSFGIVLGSWWAYYELGWGGWWFWDPVENASFMPWLNACALLHILAAVKRERQLAPWALLLCMIGFALSMIGTFLVRSGVLTSIHAFANDPHRGAFLLALLMLLMGGAITLYIVRISAFIKTTKRWHWFSREAFLLYNSFILSVIMASVLLGTLYPLILDAFAGIKLSVGAPYFNQVTLPMFALLLLGACAIPWLNKYTHLQRRIGMIVMFVFVLMLVGSQIFISAWLGFALCIYLAGLLAISLVYYGKRIGWRPQWPMLMAHAGLAITLTGMAVVKQFQQEIDINMRVGDHYQVAGYQLEFRDGKTLAGPNYDAYEGVFKIITPNATTFEMKPQKRLYHVSQQMTSEVAIHPSLFADLYVALGTQSDGVWSVRFYYKPFVRWIWLGGLLMGIGAISGVIRRGWTHEPR